MIQFPKTSHFKQKQELAKQIATAYREKAHEAFNYASPFSRKIIEDLSKGKPPEEWEEHERYLIKKIAPLGVLSQVYLSADYQELSHRYERLTNSPFLYFIRESHLSQVLQELPPKRKSIKLA